MVEMPNFHGISDKIRGSICSFGVVLANHAKFNFITFQLHKLFQLVDFNFVHMRSSTSEHLDT